jgi:hypothetical protein
MHAAKKYYYYYYYYIPLKRRFLQEAHGVTSQKTAFFIVTAVKTSNLTTFLSIWGIPVSSISLETI